MNLVTSIFWLIKPFVGINSYTNKYVRMYFLMPYLCLIHMGFLFHQLLPRPNEVLKEMAWSLQH